MRIGIELNQTVLDLPPLHPFKPAALRRMLHALPPRPGMGHLLRMVRHEGLQLVVTCPMPSPATDTTVLGEAVRTHPDLYPLFHPEEADAPPLARLFFYTDVQDKVHLIDELFLQGFLDSDAELFHRGDWPPGVAPLPVFSAPSGRIPRFPDGYAATGALLYAAHFKGFPTESSALPAGSDTRLTSYRHRFGTRGAVYKCLVEPVAEGDDRLVRASRFQETLHAHRIDAVPATCRIWPEGLLSELQEGAPPEAVGPELVDGMRRFLEGLCRVAREAEPEALPPARFARLRPADHPAALDAAYRALEALMADGDTESHANIRHFLTRDIAPARVRAQAHFHAVLAAARIDPTRVQPQARRIADPGVFDLGHTLMSKNGVPTFYGFEDSGWNDPAQLICDLFYRPEPRLTRATRKVLIETLLGARIDDPALAVRVRACNPLARLMWAMKPLENLFPERMQALLAGRPTLSERRLLRDCLLAARAQLAEHPDPAQAVAAPRGRRG